MAGRASPRGPALVLEARRVRLAVVIPMFNEENGARRCVDRVRSVLATIDPPVTMVVVDDGSADATLAVLRNALADGGGFELVAGEPNRGYGGALRLGASRASELGADWALFMDSDLTNPPEQIPAFIAAAVPGIDFVKANRYCKGGDTGDVPFKRVAISRAGNLLARLLMGLPHSDLTNGFRAFRLQAYLELPLTENGFGVILEEMHWARIRGLCGASIPSVLTNRVADLRPTSFRYSWKQIWQYLRWPLKTAMKRPLLTVSRSRRKQ